MVRLHAWQWLILVLPIAAIVLFLVVAAAAQIHAWHLNWLWAVFTLAFVGWRWLLVRWTNPALRQMEALMSQMSQEMSQEISQEISQEMTQEMTQASPAELSAGDRHSASQAAELALQEILTLAQTDAPIWQDWATFWQRCLALVTAIAQVYHPEVKYPLLNIYIPQAYGLIRGTVDDTDAWMQKLAPILNQVTLAQAYQGYELYQKLGPSARKMWQAWTWAQWLLNPVLAATKKVSRGYRQQAEQQLLLNLSQLMREAALRNLAKQAIALYSGSTLPANFTTQSTLQPPLQSTESSRPTSIARSSVAPTKTQTLQEILAQAEPPEVVAQEPISILLVGRTGAGKSSVINTLFQSELATVDVLPSTDQLRQYHWQTPTGETLTLWDTPGYEQVDRSDLRAQVLQYATTADLVLLVTPALDPALQMDLDFLTAIKAQVPDLPVIAIVSQVDRLRPLREWSPPYDWQWGERPKEVAIREATQYRLSALDKYCDRILPVVLSNAELDRPDWGIEALSLALIESIEPAQQLRLARFLKNREARILSAAQIIDRYAFQMTTTQGLTMLLKSPVLQFISTLSTGSPALAYVLADKIPVEQLPIVIGKLQLAYELFLLLNPGKTNPLQFDLRSIWSLLVDATPPVDRNAWALGHTLVEYWTQDLAATQLPERFQFYQTTAQPTP